jgi:hypothetical protein
MDTGQRTPELAIPRAINFVTTCAKGSRVVRRPIEGLQQRCREKIFGVAINST